MPSDNHFKFTDDDGDTVEVDIYSTGETLIYATSTGRVTNVILTAKAAHDLRDMLNRRFPS